VHAYGVSQEAENFQLRTVGMATTFFVLAASSLTLMGGALRLIG
jgi:uncharacterized membrane protein YecN with MAPEG domain